MLPIDRIFAEIKSLLAAQDINVPTENEILATHKKTITTIETVTGERMGRGKAGFTEDDIAPAPLPEIRVTNDNIWNLDTEKVHENDYLRMLPFASQTWELTKGAPPLAYPTFVQDRRERIKWSDGRPGAFLRIECVPSHRLYMKSHLWLAGVRRRPLHEQIMMGRSIVVTEDPNMHLVRHRYVVFIKPLPLYVMRVLESEKNDIDSEGWDGFSSLLRSYIEIVRYPSDLMIAKDIGLLPSDIRWTTWMEFSLDCLSDVNLGRHDPYPFFEYKLDTLCQLELVHQLSHFPKLSLVKPGSLYYHKCRRRYSKSPENQFPIYVGLVIGLATVCLLALLTGLNGDILSNQATFQRAAYGFVIFCLTLSSVIIASWLFGFVNIAIVTRLYEVFAASRQVSNEREWRIKELV
jgi:hypothetical protein